MGARKRLRADAMKEERRSKYFAVLRDCPSSPRKMMLVAEQIRGVEINRALDILKFSPKHAARSMEKLVKSAVANWQTKNEDARIEDSSLYVKEVFVEQGTSLKRMLPAPQGRAYRMKKRSNHVTVILGENNEQKAAE